jgi:hypothetical protein
MKENDGEVNLINAYCNCMCYNEPPEQLTYANV